MYGVRVCCFSSLDDLPAKQRSQPKKLMEFFKASGVRRVSTFEMTGKIWSALQTLERTGEIKFKESAYPWHDFEMPTNLNESGEKRCLPWRLT